MSQVEVASGIPWKALTLTVLACPALAGPVGARQPGVRAQSNPTALLHVTK